MGWELWWEDHGNIIGVWWISWNIMGMSLEYHVSSWNMAWDQQGQSFGWQKLDSMVLLSSKLTGFKWNHHCKFFGGHKAIWSSWFSSCIYCRSPKGRGVACTREGLWGADRKYTWFRSLSLMEVGGSRLSLHRRWQLHTHGSRFPGIWGLFLAFGAWMGPLWDNRLLMLKEAKCQCWAMHKTLLLPEANKQWYLTIIISGHHSHHHVAAVVIFLIFSLSSLVFFPSLRGYLF